MGYLLRSVFRYCRVGSRDGSGIDNRFMEYRALGSVLWVGLKPAVRRACGWGVLLLCIYLLSCTHTHSPKTLWMFMEPLFAVVTNWSSPAGHMWGWWMNLAVVFGGGKQQDWMRFSYKMWLNFAVLVLSEATHIGKYVCDSIYVEKRTGQRHVCAWKSSWWLPLWQGTVIGGRHQRGCLWCSVQFHKPCLQITMWFVFLHPLCENIFSRTIKICMLFCMSHFHSIYKNKIQVK